MNSTNVSWLFWTKGTPRATLKTKEFKIDNIHCERGFVYIWAILAHSAAAAVAAAVVAAAATVRRARAGRLPWAGFSFFLCEGGCGLHAWRKLRCLARPRPWRQLAAGSSCRAAEKGLQGCRLPALKLLLLLLPGPACCCLPAGLLASSYAQWLFWAILVQKVLETDFNFSHLKNERHQVINF